MTTANKAVQEYLSGLAWDGVSRLERWLVEYAGAEDTESVRYYSRRWLIQAIARAINPGCPADGCLVLVGTQGSQRSAVFRVLAGPWFLDVLDVRDKDAIVALRDAWIVNVALKSCNFRVKAFLASTGDRYRPPYQTHTEIVLRPCVFGSVLNAPVAECGERRLWCVQVGVVDIAALEGARDQLWAEAREAYWADMVA